MRIAALGIVLVAVLGAAPPLAGTADHATAEPTDPSLPVEFAEFSPGTAWAVDQPGGAAIALYESGDSDLFGLWQTLLAGAYRDTYRQVETAVNDVLLSPDGRYVLYFHARRGTDEFTLIDLSTGQAEVRHSVEWMSNVGGGITMLAWSPDGRYMAYAVPHPSPNDGRAESSLRNGIPLRDVAILDIVNDTNVLFPMNTVVLGGAFSPDSQRVAVLADPESPVLGTDGTQVGTWERPTEIVPTGPYDGRRSMAWSPDGSLIALELGLTGGGNQPDIGLVDMTGTGQVSADLTGYLLGWRSPTSVLVASYVNQAEPWNGPLELIEESTVDGSRTVLSRFPSAGGCGPRNSCGVYNVQVATNLVQHAGSRPSDPDRGLSVPVDDPGSVMIAAIVGTALIAVIVTVVVWRRRGRRHSAHPARS